MRFNFFNKGLATRVAPHLVPNGAGISFTNIDNAKGHFIPEKDKLEDPTVTGVLDFGYYFEQNSQWFFTNSVQDYAIYGRQLFTSDRTGVPQKLVGSSTWRNLGIEAPTVAPTLTVTNGPSVISRFDTVETIGSGGDLAPTETLRYLAVNVDTVTGYKNFDAGTEIGITGIDEAYFERSSGDLFGSLIHELRTSDTALARKIELSCEDTNFANEVEMYRLFDSTWRLVGTLTSTSDTLEDNTYDISANTALNVEAMRVNGVIQYAVTFYNSIDGSESAPVFTDEVDVQFGIVELTNLPVSTDPQVDKKRIYRIGNFVTTFTEVAEIDNSVTSYTDSKKDVELDSTSLLTSNNYGQAPAGLQYLLVSNAMMFGASGDQLRFTPIGRPNAWLPEYFLQFPETITGLAEVQLGILVFLEDSTYLVTGTSPVSLSQQVLTLDQGCTLHDSIVVIAGTALWTSKDGLCASNGSEPRVVTKDKLGKVNFSGVHAVVHDEQYYLQLTDGSTFVWDYRYEATPKYLELGVTSFAVADDILYGIFENSAYKLFAAEDYLTATFKSGWLFANALHAEKALDQLKGYTTGEVTVKLYVNGELANTFNYSDQGVIDDKVNKFYTRYNYVELEITGQGQVMELSWEDEQANG